MFAGAFLLAAAVGQLQNPGFEAATLSGWETKIYHKSGRDPVVRLDSSRPGEGRQCLLIEASDPASAGVSQTLYLTPGSLYRLRASIRTEVLSGDGGPTGGGLIEIDTPAGRVGKSGPKPGNSEWKEETVMFRVPSPGQVRVVLANFEPGRALGTGKSLVRRAASGIGGGVRYRGCSHLGKGRRCADRRKTGRPVHRVFCAV